MSNGRRDCAPAGDFERAHAHLADGQTACSRVGPSAAGASDRDIATDAVVIADDTVGVGDRAAAVNDKRGVVTATKIADIHVGRRMVDRTAANLESATLDRGAAGVGVRARENVEASAIDDLRRAGDDNGNTSRGAILGEVVGREVGGCRAELERTRTGTGGHRGRIQDSPRRRGVGRFSTDVQCADTCRVVSENDSARSAADVDDAAVGNNKRAGAGIPHTEVAEIIE